MNLSVQGDQGLHGKVTTFTPTRRASFSEEPYAAETKHICPFREKFPSKEFHTKEGSEALSQNSSLKCIFHRASPQRWVECRRIGEYAFSIQHPSPITNLTWFPFARRPTNFDNLTWRQTGENEGCGFCLLLQKTTPS